MCSLPKISILTGLTVCNSKEWGEITKYYFSVSPETTSIDGKYAAHLLIIGRGKEEHKKVKNNPKK